MSVPPNEQVVPDEEGSQNPEPEQQQQSGGNPAWDDLLSDLPDELHGILKPKLQEWDTKVQDQFQQIHQQYDPYKPLVEHNIDINVVQQALALAHQLETDPAALVRQAIDHFNLEEFKAQQAAANSDPSNVEDPDNMFDADDYEDDPRYKALLEKQQEIEQQLNEQREAREAAEAEEALNNYLNNLHETHGNFDDDYVVTLIANGMDGEAAVKQFQNIVNQAVSAFQQQGAPANAGQGSTKQEAVIAGSGGTTGSGVPDKPIDFGTMKNGDINDLVAQYIQNANSQ